MRAPEKSRPETSLISQVDLEQIAIGAGGAGAHALGDGVALSLIGDRAAGFGGRLCESGRR